MKTTTNILLFASFIATLFFYSGCATAPLKGVAQDGKKIYLDNSSINQTTAFQSYLKSSGTEADKLTYLNERLKSAQNVVFYMDGERYTWREAYEGGSWLLRKKFEKDQDARDFLKENVWYSESSRKPNLLEFPGGEVHVGYYVFLNELELLEETVLKQS